MASTASEFKKRRRKIVALPSGLEVEIQRLKLWDLFDLGELPQPLSDADGAEEQTRGAGLSAAIDKQTPKNIKEILEYENTLVVRACMAPCFCLNEDEETDETVCVDALEGDDRKYLIAQIFEFSGLGRDDARAADRFRGNGVSESNSDVGQGVPGPSKLDL